MKLFRLVLCTLLLLSLQSRAQQALSVKGIVEDEKHLALPGATVFLTNTKSITASGNKGDFHLDNLTSGTYQLVVKMIGYAPFVQQVQLKDGPVELKVRLKPSSLFLKEVKVHPDYDREKHLVLFKKEFLGQSYNARYCKLQNPDVLYFSYDKKAKVLTANTDEFLIVENKALGYEIRYLLADFGFNENTRIVTFQGYPSFKELKGSPAQQAVWDKNRRTAYLGSINHFIKSVYSGRVFQEGFVVMKLRNRPMQGILPEKGKQPVLEDRIISFDSLPETLNVASKASTEVLHRGIFDAIVYSTKTRVSGKFSPLELKKSGINPELVQWDKAKIDFGISDLKGLKNNPVIHLAGRSYNIEPDFTDLRLFTNNLVILPDLDSVKNTLLDFSFDLDLRGSDELNFLHLGKSTTVKLEGNWNNPSFTGRYLPDSRQVTDAGFTATWKMPYFNRPYAQQWMAENSIMDVKTSDASFGVKFILPVDQYQKTMRSAKYAILIILLTFISLFFTEIIQKRKVHFLQYLLIGAAMTVYYTLLLSFSEQMGFTIAYLIASVATIALIGFFIAAVLKNRKPAMVFAAILSVFYSFIYVIIQLQDLALLFGSVGLFLIIAVMMFLSAKIDWNKDSSAELAV